MKIIRSAILALALCLPGFSSARADANWLTDFQKAQQEAKASHKLLLINFTGSDWCPWCIRLHREVFSQNEFADYAKNNLVLVVADFPRAKPVSREVRKQNSELAQRFNVEGFPTIVVLNGDGKEVAELGYMPGGPSAFIAELKKLPKS